MRLTKEWLALRTPFMMNVCLQATLAVSEPQMDAMDLVKNSLLYKEYLAECDEILRHKWIESEKAACDIGFERAWMDWIVNYRSVWLQNRRNEPHGYPFHWN
jgi:hypothetical protein